MYCVNSFNANIAVLAHPSICLNVAQYLTILSLQLLFDSKKTSLFSASDVDCVHATQVK